MKRKPVRRNRSSEKQTFPKAVTPSVGANEFRKKPLEDLDVPHMQALAHSAIMWADHDGGTILNKESNPYWSELSMEHTEKTKDGKMQTGFTVRSSPFSNGNMMVLFWQDEELVFCATDTPGGNYQYPSRGIQVTTYKPGKWEKFLDKKGYRE